MVKLASEDQAKQKKATRAAYGATLAELAGEGVPVVAVDADLVDVAEPVPGHDVVVQANLDRVLQAHARARVQ